MGFIQPSTFFYMVIPMNISSRTPLGYKFLWFCMNGIQFRMDHFVDLFQSSVCVCPNLDDKCCEFGQYGVKHAFCWSMGSSISISIAMRPGQMMIPEACHTSCSYSTIAAMFCVLRKQTSSLQTGGLMDIARNSMYNVKVVLLCV